MFYENGSFPEKVFVPSLFQSWEATTTATSRGRPTSISSDDLKTIKLLVVVNIVAVAVAVVTDSNEDVDKDEGETSFLEKSTPA